MLGHNYTLSHLLHMILLIVLEEIMKCISLYVYNSISAEDPPRYLHTNKKFGPYSQVVSKSVNLPKLP